MSKHSLRSAVGLHTLTLLLVGLAGACGSSMPSSGGAGGGGKAGAAGAGGGGGQGGMTAGSGGGGAGDRCAGASGCPGVPTMVGPSGGVASGDGVALTIPSGALAADTVITVGATSATATGYTMASAVYEFGPSGTVFAQPVTVSIPLTSAMPDAHLFWSNASGGFDDSSAAR